MEKIGLYPIVDSINWLTQLYQWGVTTVQLRVKSESQIVLETLISKAQALAQFHQTNLVINDHWQLAIKYHAQIVHLGQQDLLTADITAIKKAGIKIGISTHNQKEIDKALKCQPDYIAFGPIYHTDTKVMPYRLKGCDKLRDCCQRVDCPVVAIGGINRKNIVDVINTGVSGIAMISAITQAQDPRANVNYFLQQING